MNILIAAYYTAPFGGNFIGSMQDLALKIREKGDNIVFLFPLLQSGKRPWVHWLENSGYQVILADLNAKEEQQIEFLRDVLDKNQIDLIHLHFDMYFGLVMHHSEVFAKCKVLIHDHMGYSTGHSIIKQRIRFALYSAIYFKRGYGLITVSKQKKKAYPFLAKKWYIPNGLSLKRNVDHFASREETRQELGVQDDQILVTLLGWDMKRKGVDIAAKAVSKLYEEGKNVVLGLLGGSAKQYHSFIRQYGVDPESPWINYLDGREDIYSLHRAADVFLSASRDEGFPYAILEAISQETPVVVSDIPETRWALEYNKCSVYPVEDFNACADAIMQSASFGRNKSNADDLVDRFSIDNWCKNVIEKYDKMVKR